MYDKDENAHIGTRYLQAGHLLYAFAYLQVWARLQRIGKYVVNQWRHLKRYQPNCVYKVLRYSQIDRKIA